MPERSLRPIGAGQKGVLSGRYMLYIDRGLATRYGAKAAMQT
jgi:hypothetical protein